MSRSFSELLDWQWAHYAETQRDRVNLVVHAVTVPLFWIGALRFVSALLFAGLFFALGGVLLMGLCVFLQALGNSREAKPPESYANAWDFLQRVAAEQFVSFPRFVLSGGWWRNLQESA